MSSMEYEQRRVEAAEKHAQAAADQVQRNAEGLQLIESMKGLMAQDNIATHLLGEEDIPHIARALFERHWQPFGYDDRSLAIECMKAARTFFAITREE